MLLSRYIAIAAALAVFGFGWQSRAWYDDSVSLAEKTAIDKAMSAFADKESKIASVVENKIQELKANERIIEKWRTKVIDRPIYNIECIDDDGLRLIEGYAKGNSGVSASKVPE